MSTILIEKKLGLKILKIDLDLKDKIRCIIWGGVATIMALKTSGTGGR